MRYRNVQPPRLLIYGSSASEVLLPRTPSPLPWYDIEVDPGVVARLPPRQWPQNLEEILIQEIEKMQELGMTKGSLYQGVHCLM